MSNNKISDVRINIAEKATVIWNVTDMLRRLFKPHEYGLVILPMTVVKRFHDCLLATPDNIETNFKDYLVGFSANAQDVLSKYDFDNIITLERRKERILPVRILFFL